jgi:hypothetical protein
MVDPGNLPFPYKIGCGEFKQRSSLVDKCLKIRKGEINECAVKVKKECLMSRHRDAKPKPKTFRFSN